MTILWDTWGSRQDHTPEKNHSEVWKKSRYCFPADKRAQALLVSRNCSYRGSEKESDWHTGNRGLEGEIRPDQGGP